MAKFFYIARNKIGHKITGMEEAPSQEEVISRLQARDLIIINIIPEEKEIEIGLKERLATKIKLRRRHYGVKSDDLVLFCRQLATLLGAGVTILKSLDVISQQVTSLRLYQVIRDLQKNMEAGLSLHEAMAKHPKVFSELWVNLAESGEASGNMAVILSRLANYLERNASFMRKVISALIYPAILVVVGLGALIFLTVKVIPTFAQLFSGFNLSLPLLTRILVAISNFIRRFLLVGIVAIVVLFFLVRKYISTNKDARRKYERLLFTLPVFGDFFRVLVIERFTSEMSTLVESGVPILYSLEITEHSVGSLLMSDLISKIKDEVREGRPLSLTMDKSGFFEPMVVQMVTIGEEIGELPNMLKRLNTYFQEYIETFIARLTSVFEPIMLIFMGLVIGIMVVGMFLPIFQIARIGG